MQTNTIIAVDMDGTFLTDPKPSTPNGSRILPACRPMESHFVVGERKYPCRATGLYARFEDQGLTIAENGAYLADDSGHCRASREEDIRAVLLRVVRGWTRSIAGVQQVLPARLLRSIVHMIRAILKKPVRNSPRPSPGGFCGVLLPWLGHD